MDDQVQDADVHAGSASKQELKVEPIRKVGIVGAGQMGSGIAHVVALGGYDVVAAVVFAFAVIAAGTPVLWTGAGAVLLTLLFLGSTAFTEWISRSRHPEFEDYQRTTSMLVPWRPRRDAR